jgi:hypothetical protein
LKRGSRFNVHVVNRPTRFAAFVKEQALKHDVRSPLAPALQPKISL